MPALSSRPLSWLLAAVVAATSVGAACTPVGGKRYSRSLAQKSLSKLEAPGLIVGEFTLTKVVDGDTVRVDGLDASLRLLGMDTEETFKSESNRRAVETDWDAYLRVKRGKFRPGRIETPTGEVAKAWAKKFFDGSVRVRVERDHPAEIRDRFNRYLAYVLVEKDGKWLNFNVESVRAGMSPYYTKYGHSRRYHEQFVAAQAEAQAAKRGIWASGIKNYPDYPERFAWWGPRADFIDAFRTASEGKDNFIDLTHWNAMKLLEEHVGSEVQMLGVISDVRYAERGPARVMLSYRQFRDFPLIFFDRDVLVSSGITDKWKQEFVWVTGVPTIYENKHTKKKQVQIKIDSASQIRLCPVPGLPPPPALPTAGVGP
ncbi:MAG TPA: thermonuclease family protein [Kofleriaceae bacterium]|nr:thermonuclease family protein [Kofleriaceae bacterium]